MEKGIKPIEVFTDGSCDPNPGPGGWAAIIIEGKNKSEIMGFSALSTNNRMELTAALEALRHIDTTKPVRIYTDSQYLQRGVTEWMKTWKAKNWKRKGGALANVDLWKALSEEIGHRKLLWKWIKGHAGHPFNERADQLAHKMIESNR